MSKAVPWEFTETPLIKVWLWTTEHFDARIFSEGIAARRKFSWRITDKTQGRDRPFDSNESSTFQEATTEILEVIGKSYPAKLGYHAYAGPLATTFATATGKKLDFGPLNGMSVIVKAIEDDGSDKVIVGSLRVVNFIIQIRIGDEAVVDLPPERIKDIQSEITGRSFLENDQTPKVQSSTGKRVFHTEYQKGCTGRPGYRKGTVEHSPSDSFCPIHNV